MATTPPRKREHSWRTPALTRKSLRFSAAPMDLPFITQSGRSSLNLKHNLETTTATSASAIFLPTPLTIGTGRKTRLSFPIKPSGNSRGLTAKLLSMASETNEPPLEAFTEEQAQTQEGTEILDECEEPQRSSLHESVDLKCSTTPISNHIREFSTPPPKPRIEQKPVFEPFADSPDECVVRMSIDELHKIPHKKLQNPFLTLSKRDLPPLNLKVDYSTHLELINHRTGERKIEELSDEQRLLKPRKLDFSLAEHVPVKLNYNITNKYIENTLGLKFSMESSQAKNPAGFDIFSPPS